MDKPIFYIRRHRTNIQWRRIKKVSGCGRFYIVQVEHFIRFDLTFIFSKIWHGYLIPQTG